MTTRMKSTTRTNPTPGIPTRLAGLGWATLLLTASGCTAGMATSIQEAGAPAEPTAVSRLAVMPLTTEAGSEGIRARLDRSLAAALREAFPSLPLLSPEESRRRLSESGATREYARMLEEYDRTGAADARRLRAVAAALEVDHFLQLRASYLREEFLEPYLFDDDLTEEQRQVVAVVARLWRAGSPAPVWEAVVRTESDTDEFHPQPRERDELLEQVARSLAETVPIRAPSKAVPPESRDR